jgi:hypothetical protein
MSLWIKTLATVVALVGTPGCATRPPEPTPAERDVARQILDDPELPAVLEKARALLKTGFTAGTGYGEVWIRDLNTFIEVSLGVNEWRQIRDVLLTFLKFQGPQGDIPDGFIAKERADVNYRYRQSALAPGLLAHKNTVETDQESSLVQAVAKYVRVTADRAILEENIDGRLVRDRLGDALNYVLTERFDRAHGLVWGATTADWGDVQPEHPWGVELDARSHRALDIYDNAMLIIAMNDYLELIGPKAEDYQGWIAARDELKRSVREHLWDSQRRKFIPHIYLAGSPFPNDFDESAVFYHGGTAVAIEAGLLTQDEVRSSLEQMRANVRAAGASSIGLTLHPAYPSGSFQNKAMEPYGYQNGGDWCWFGGRMVRQLAERGLVEDAYHELKPMLSRVLRHGDFYEWWSLDNQPRGSSQYRGSAGVLAIAIEQLMDWARHTAN